MLWKMNVEKSRQQVRFFFDADPRLLQKNHPLSWLISNKIKFYSYCLCMHKYTLKMSSALVD